MQVGLCLAKWKTYNNRRGESFCGESFPNKVWGGNCRWRSRRRTQVSHSMVGAHISELWVKGPLCLLVRLERRQCHHCHFSHLLGTCFQSRLFPWPAKVGNSSILRVAHQEWNRSCHICIYICKVFMKVIFLLMAFLCSITVNFWHRGCYSKRSALSDSYLLKSRLTFAICFAVLPLAPK